MKATNIIKRDHRAAEELFEQYKKAGQDKREPIAEKIFAALDTHENMEDTYFYPELEDKMSEDPAFIELEEQQEELKNKMETVREMSGDRDEAIKGLMEEVLEHAKREEKEILSKAEEILSEAKLEELGEKMEPESAVAQAKQ